MLQRDALETVPQGDLLWSGDYADRSASGDGNLQSWLRNAGGRSGLADTAAQKEGESYAAGAFLSAFC